MSLQHPLKRRILKPAKTLIPARLEAGSVRGQAMRPAPVQQATIQRALANPQRLQPEDVIQLQRMLGNRAVGSLLAGERTSELRVGPSNDTHEREARQVASQVAGHASVQRSTDTPSVPEVGAAGGPVSSSLENNIQRAKGGGRPVPDQVRLAMERQTGVSYRDVRIHEGKQAQAANAAMGAHAFTQGKHIFLGHNQSPHDVQLMAHELTHTVQQGGVKAASGMKQGGVPGIQREDDDEKQKKIKKINQKLGGAKIKKGLAKAGAVGMTALDWLTTLPLRLIDELSIADLHAKDFKNFVKTGKTRGQRIKGGYTATEKSRTGKEKLGPQSGTTTRRTGRTGLRALLSGVNIHGSGMHARLPWLGKANPFSWLVGGATALNKTGKNLGKEMGDLRGQKQGLRDQMVEEMKDNDQQNPMEDEVLEQVLSTLEDEEKE